MKGGCKNRDFKMNKEIIKTKGINLNLKEVDDKTLLFILKQIKKEMKKRGIKKVCKYKIKYNQLKKKCQGKD